MTHLPTPGSDNGQKVIWEFIQAMAHTQNFLGTVYNTTVGKCYIIAFTKGY